MMIENLIVTELSQRGVSVTKKRRDVPKSLGLDYRNDLDVTLPFGVGKGFCEAESLYG